VANQGPVDGKTIILDLATVHHTALVPHKVGFMGTKKAISREVVVCLNGRELICGEMSTRLQMQRVGYVVAQRWQQTVCKGFDVQVA